MNEPRQPQAESQGEAMRPQQPNSAHNDQPTGGRPDQPDGHSSERVGDWVGEKVGERGSAAQRGSLDPSHTPKNDPLKGIRGVMAGTHIMEAIVILLVLTVVTRVDEGASATPFALGYITAVGVLMVLAAFLQRVRWADGLNIGLQVVAIGGFIVHPSMGVVALLFAAVWWYIYHLKKTVEMRLARGLLPSQHLEN